MDNECSSSSQYPTWPSDPTVASSSGAGDDIVPPIFLSHSGEQKTFVEHLYNALQNANQTPFFDQHTLPKASRFPDHIKRAARGCKLGVVVLSETFLTSKWPMLELEMLVLERGPDALVFPLFYKLRPEDLKDSANLSRWRSVWKEIVGDHQADRWYQAVRTLRSHNGLVRVPGASEIAYINSVVRRICALVPCNAQYSFSFVQGRPRLVQEIAKMFEQVKNRNPESRPCLVGLHGVGGLGKTTLCKSMVDFYTTQYLGKAWRIEFPTDGELKKITQECKRALKKLTNLSDEPLRNVGDDFEKVIGLMEKYMRRHNVFLAIDNVWKNSLDKAEKLLKVCFSGSSKILLTCRSERLLQNLLAAKSSTSYIIRPLPAPEYEEAFQIFQESVKLGNLRDLVNEEQIGRVLEKCRFNGKFLALALKALALYVYNENLQHRAGEFKDRLSSILEDIRSSDLESVEEVIMLGYKSLASYKQNIFLDIAYLEIIKQASYIVVDATQNLYEPTLWLYKLYDGENFSKGKIKSIITDLALDGLIEMGAVDADSENMIGVHDLYLDFARMEAANSPRFFTEASLNKAVEEIKWRSLERVILFLEEIEEITLDKFRREIEMIEYEVSQILGLKVLQQQKRPRLKVLTDDRKRTLDGDEESQVSQVSRFLEELQQQECPRLKVLVVYNGPINSPIHLDCMPALCVLLLLEQRILFGWDFASRRVEFRSGEERSGVLKQTGPCLLQVLSFYGGFTFTEIAGLHVFQNLRRLELYYCYDLEKIDGLSGLVRLEGFAVFHSWSLTELPDLSGLRRLESLTLNGLSQLKEVGRLSSALKHVSVVFTALKKVPDVSGLRCLETLELRFNDAMEEVGGICFSSTLKSLQICGCAILRRLPRWNDSVIANINNVSA